MINYEDLAESNLSFINEIKDAVNQAIDSGYYILGPNVKKFEAEFAAYTSSRYCVGVGNGLDALTISLACLDLPKNSEVIVPANTYIATILAVINAGLKPKFVEPDPRSYNICPDAIIKALTAKTSAICITHLYGKPCNMRQISNIALANNLRLIEDCAQSHGAKYNGQTTGTFGDAGCFSFYPTKNLGALGDGGAIVTNNQEVYEKALHLRNYGSTIKYKNKYIGYNSRLDELQAAVLQVKLRYLDKINAHKRRLAAIYLANLPRWLTLPSQDPNEYNVFHIFPVMCEKRDNLRQYLLDNGVKTEVHYPVPPHKQEALSEYRYMNLPITEMIHARELSLPISYLHSEADIENICNILLRYTP